MSTSRPRPFTSATPRGERSPRAHHAAPGAHPPARIDGKRQESRGGGTESAWVFTRMHRVDRQGPLHTRAVYNMVCKKIVPILGRKISPHAFRHSYGTHI